MKKFFLTTAAAILSSIWIQAQEYPQLGAKLEEYFTALAGESAELQSRECDFLIESSADSLVRQFVALRIYDHYTSSRIMGDDAVAVHIVDNWLANGKIAMRSEEELLAAKMYAEFNRNSLIGKKAPLVNLKTAAGKKVRVPASGKYNVLYFYDTSCATCKVETARLREFLAGSDYNIKVWAIYVGSNAASWQEYRKDFDGVSHVWDPSMDSDWQRLYGVLGTPRMFLVNPDGIIIGRGLDTPALNVLLSREFTSGKYSYGEESQTARYDQMFATYGDTLSVRHILEVADYLAARTFGEGNLDSFKQVEGDLLYYLSQQRGEVYKDAIIPFVNRYVKIPDVWETPEDEAQIVSLGNFLSEMTARTPVGSTVPDITVPGTVRRKPFPLLVKGSKEGLWRLGKLKGRTNYIVFYSAGCSNCQELLSRIDSIAAESCKVRVLLIDMDAAMDGLVGQTLLDTFDLTALPFVIQTNRKGVIQHRYVQL